MKKWCITVIRLYYKCSLSLTPAPTLTPTPTPTLTPTPTPITIGKTIGFPMVMINK